MEKVTKNILDKTKLKIGWIGTGIMGSSMCKHLLKSGFSLTVSNRTISKAKALEEFGAKVTTDLVALAKESDYLFLMLGYPKDVEEMVLGEKGLLKYMKKNSYLIDHTTSSPGLAKTIYQEALKNEIYSYDAPVTGGDLGAREGKLVTLVGGNKENFEDNLLPLLNTYSKDARLLGDAGMGQHAKMANQICIASNINGLCECLLYSYKAGLDVKQLIDMISQGAAGSNQINIYANKMIDRNFEAGFFIEHFLKDIEIAIEESNKMGLNLNNLKYAKTLYEIMVKDGLGRLGHHGLLLALEKLNKVDIDKEFINKENKNI